MPTGREVIRGLGWAVIAVGLVELSGASFGGKARQRILRRDGGVSAESGEESDRLEIAHYNHNKRDPRHNNIANGRAVLPTEHYADHFNRHGTRGLGLSDEENRWALKSIWARLTPEERATLPEPAMVGQDFIPRRGRG